MAMFLHLAAGDQLRGSMGSASPWTATTIFLSPSLPLCWVPECLSLAGPTDTACSSDGSSSGVLDEPKAPDSGVDSTSQNLLWL
jgi:hypothetical protein